MCRRWRKASARPLLASYLACSSWLSCSFLRSTAHSWVFSTCAYIPAWHRTTTTTTTIVVVVVVVVVVVILLSNLKQIKHSKHNNKAGLNFKYWNWVKQEMEPYLTEEQAGFREDSARSSSWKGCSERLKANRKRTESDNRTPVLEISVVSSLCHFESLITCTVCQ